MGHPRPDSCVAISADYSRWASGPPSPETKRLRLLAVAFFFAYSITAGLVPDQRTRHFRAGNTFAKLSRELDLDHILLPTL